MSVRELADAAATLDEILSAQGLARSEVGLLIVDHGSRRAESNSMLQVVAQQFQAGAGWPLVEPAHMEIAEPSIATAMDRLVAGGARFILVHPYFLFPGRHWHDDIPRLAAQAASRHGNLPYLVTAPLGLHPLLLQVIASRLVQCAAHAWHGGPTCDVCTVDHSCTIAGQTSRLTGA